MKVLNKDQFERLIEDTPEGGVVFAEYEPDLPISKLMVTDSGGSGSLDVIPVCNEIYNWDWCIEDYSSDDMFMVFNNNDVLQMIQTLTSRVSGLRINLEDY